MMIVFFSTSPLFFVMESLSLFFFFIGNLNPMLLSEHTTAIRFYGDQETKHR